MLTQELVGNAIPLGLVLHLGVALRDFVAPLLGTSFPTVLPTSTPTIEPSSAYTLEPPPTPPLESPTLPLAPPALTSQTMSAPKLLLRRPSLPPKMRRRLQHQIRLGGFARSAVRRLLFKRWCYLQRRRLHEAVTSLRDSRACTSDEARVWLSKGLHTISQSWDGVSAIEPYLDSHPASLLWWQWREHLWSELRDGVRLPFVVKPTRITKRNATSAIHPNVDREFDRLHRLGYMVGPFDEPARSSSSPEVAVVNKVLAVPKKDAPSKPRMCMDFTGSKVNPCLEWMKFLYPSFDDCADLLYPGAWMAKVDLSDGFFHCKVHQAFQKYLGLRRPSDNKLYRYSVFPFGLMLSPFYFTEIMSELHRTLRRHHLFAGAVAHNAPGSEGYNPALPTVYSVNQDGICCKLAVYMDDIMLTAPSYRKCRAAMNAVGQALAHLGLREKPSKREGPSRSGLNFLGIGVDTSGGRVTLQVPQHRKVRLRTLVADFLRLQKEGSRVNRRELASLIGQLAFYSRVLPPARGFLRNLYSCLHPPGSTAAEAADYRRNVQVTAAALDDLRWWGEALATHSGTSVLRSADARTLRQSGDASGGGWGVTLEEPGSGKVLFAHGLWPTAVSAQSSNLRELLTILQGLKLALLHRQDSAPLRVVVYSDNSTAVSCVNSGSSPSPELLLLARDIKMLQAREGLQCDAVWIAGSELIRQGADPLSRGAWPFSHVHAAERVTFDPYAAVESVVPAAVLQLLRRHLPSATLVSRPDEWHQDELESQFSLLAPAPTAVRSCLLHFFDAHRRRHTATTAVAAIPCVANAEWYRLLRYFGDHVTLRFGPDGRKLTFPVVVAFAPPIRTEASGYPFWSVLRSRLLALNATGRELRLQQQRQQLRHAS